MSDQAGPVTRRFRVQRCKKSLATSWSVHEVITLDPDADDPVEARYPVDLSGEHGILTPGSEISAVGAWTSNKYGTQFKASVVIVDVQRDERSLTAYLSALGSVGPFMARDALKTHGAAKILDALEAGTAEAVGLPKACAEEWVKRLGISDSFRYLATIPQLEDDDRAEILEALGATAREALTRNPYAALSETGWTFPRADQTARRAFAIGPEDSRRLVAAIRFALGAEAQEGHVWTPAGFDLNDRAKGIDWSKAIAAGIEAGQVVQREDKAIALHGYARAERELAGRIRTLAKSRGVQLAAAPLDKLPADLTDEQRQAATRCYLFGFSVLVGGPGTGKTKSVTGVLALARALGWSVALAAPTAKAAGRITEQTGVKATTIHRLLGTTPDEGFEFNEHNPLVADLVVLDETSMLDVSLANSVLAACRPERTRVLFVGDPDQLPSIGPGSVLADIVASGAAPVTALTKIFRQASDSPIPHAAAELRTGRPMAFGLDRAAGLVLAPTLKSDQIAERVVAAVTSKLQAPGAPTKGGGGRRAFKLSEIQVMSPQRSGDAGVDSLNRKLQEAINPSDERVYIGNRQAAAVGDRVIHTKNEAARQVFNGDQGVVAFVDLRAPRGMPVLSVDFGEGRVIGYTRQEARRLDLAYALTVHKMQGSQAPCVVFAADAAHSFMLTRALVYTAVTRAAEFCAIIGDPRTVAACARNTRGSKRRTRLKEELANAI